MDIVIIDDDVVVRKGIGQSIDWGSLGIRVAGDAPNGCLGLELIRPISSVVVITSFIAAWNEYPFSLILVSKEVYRTISIGIRFFGQEHTFNYTLYFAALVVSIAPVLLLYSVLSKFIVQGMTMGAVKG